MPRTGALASQPDAALREARVTTRRVARTFALACRLLPTPVRDDVYRLYLVFRTLDDAVDHGDPAAEERVAAVERWARGGAASSREAGLLAQVAERHPVPRPALVDFCRGMRDDLEGRALRSEEDLDRYCYRVAGTVGLVLAAVLGTRAPAEREAAAFMYREILREIERDGYGLSRARAVVPRRRKLALALRHGLVAAP